MKKNILRWVKVIVLLYCIVGIAIYYLQDKLLLHPIPLDKTAVLHLEQPFTELNLPYDQKTNLNVVEFKATDRSKDSLAKGVVIYFHGNVGNISLHAPEATPFTTQGYELWMMDYPGFGKSTGQFTEAKLYEQALILYKLARSRWRPDQIIICGSSLGTGIAAQLASIRDCKRLILLSPYYSLTSLARHYAPVYPVGQMLHYHFPTDTWLPAVAAPVSIFHGDKDDVIPLSNGRKLQPLLKAGDEFITIEGAGHNNMMGFPVFQEKLNALLRM